MKNFICLSIIFLFLVSCATLPLPFRIEPGIRYAVEYYPYCPTFEFLFRNKNEEVIAFISSSGKTVIFSSYELRKTRFRKRNHWVDPLKEDLMRYGIMLTDVDLIIHNHSSNTDFSEGDLYFLSVIREHGFKGAFAIYFIPTKKIVPLREKDETF